MAEILHHLIGSLSHYLQEFIHLRWCRSSSISSSEVAGLVQMKNVYHNGLVCVDVILLIGSHGVHHKQTTIWENMFGFLFKTSTSRKSKYLKGLNQSNGCPEGTGCK